MKKPSAAIYFHPEGYSTKGEKLMGRHAAGESFLKGFFRQSSSPVFCAFIDKPKFRDAFLEQMLEANPAGKAAFITPQRMDVLSKVGALYCPGPSIGKFAWMRRHWGDRQWSLCGITHTTSSAGAMDSIVDWTVAPVQPWDAVICTSAAVRDNVLRILAAQKDYLRNRLGAEKMVLPRLPVIPLGINTSEFDIATEEKQRARATLGVGSKSHVVLFVGRLSFHAKAHPLPLYIALEEVAKSLPRDENIVLVECGWHSNAYIANAFSDAAASVCPSVRVITADGRDSEKRRIAWSAADVFCSLSDNIQETFGITPVEAMAAGLPSIVSDWDGYRDTVRDGVDGFRIPTLMPSAYHGEGLARQHAIETISYDRYCGFSGAQISVDISATVRAFKTLFSSPSLRKKMGENAQQRAREVYDWNAIVRRYESLWEELAERRRTGTASDQRGGNSWPARLDPFYSFASYPTGRLTDDLMLRVPGANLEDARTRLESYRKLAMVSFADEILPSVSVLTKILEGACPDPITVCGLLDLGEKQESSRSATRAGIAWLLKVGLLEIGQASGSSNLLTVAALGLKKQAAVTEQRVDYPLSALNELPGVRAFWSSEGLHIPPDTPVGVIVLHRQFMNSPGLVAAIERKISQGWVVVSDIDDDPRNWNEFVESDYFAFRGVHGVTVSTEAVAELMRQWNPNVAVLPNAILNLPHFVRQVPKNGKHIRIFFGAINRKNDWQGIMDGIRSALYGLAEKVELVVVHDKEFYENFDDRLSKTFYPTLPPAEYLSVLQSCDIALLPLENTEFNRLKSDLKFIECCAASVVPICSPVVYQLKSEHQEIGLFATSARQWKEAIEHLCSNTRYIEERKNRGYEYVEASRLHQHQAPFRYKIYKDWLSTRRLLEVQRIERLSGYSDV